MGERRIKIVSRKSNLALEQVREVMRNFSDQKYQLLKLLSLGDKKKKVSLMSDLPDDFFTRELDKCLLNNIADVAVHSAKDLPDPLPAGLEVIALTRSLDKRDGLVSKNGSKLMELPSGVKIGTSSFDRRSQILAQRPDLKIISVRGNIEERLALVDNGKIDALVVAVCALERLGLKHRLSEILTTRTHPLQGNLAVVARKERADLKVLFSKIDVRNSYGKVYLVGAGTGDKDLLTIKAEKILHSSDVIYYDDLIDAAILNDISCKKIYVGKRKGKQIFSQESINEMIYKDVQSGKKVARLKCGDPFIFGRGGEELSYLHDRMVHVEVIPGVSAMQVAAAATGIPLTMRGISNQLSMKTAHSISELTKDNETVVYYMGATKLSQVRNKLISEGRKSNTPVALIQNAGSTDENIEITDIKRMASTKLASPLIIMIGNVVDRYIKTPKLLFTGLDHHNIAIPGKIIDYPLIEVCDIDFNVKDLGSYDAVVFTSKSAVKAFFKRYKLNKEQKIIAIGPYTKKEVERSGYRVSYMPRTADSDFIGPIIKKAGFKKILYPCSNISNNSIHKNKKIVKLVAYVTKFRRQPKIALSPFDGIIFSSPSTVDGFFRIYKKIPEHMAAYVYGAHTRDLLLKKGFKNVQTLQIS